MTALPALLCKDKAVTLIMKGCDLTPEEMRAFESFASIEVLTRFYSFVCHFEINYCNCRSKTLI